MDGQCYDLISGAGLEPLLVGGRGQASGFIMRMMAENKKKHNGSYKNPTAPLHPDSTMNGAVPFDYGKLANKGQKGTNKSDYGASPFIERTFGTNKKAEEETDTQKDARAKAQSEDLLKKAEELLAASKKKSKVQEFLTGVLKKRKAKGVLKGLKEAKAKKDEEDVFTDVPELTIKEFGAPYFKEMKIDKFFSFKSESLLMDCLIKAQLAKKTANDIRYVRRPFPKPLNTRNVVYKGKTCDLNDALTKILMDFKKRKSDLDQPLDLDTRAKVLYDTYYKKS